MAAVNTFLFLTCLHTTLSLPFYGIDKYSESYSLPDLPFAYDALEPFIDEATVRVHHTGHHLSYTKKLNAALAQWRADPNTKSNSLAYNSILEILTAIEDIPDQYRNAIRNNGGGYVNHNLYWSVLAPNSKEGENLPLGDFIDDIEKDFGNFSTFRQLFTREAAKLFGSGYVWLSRQPDNDGLLVVSTSVNQDCPLSKGLHPILVLDVWEHAYYLKHQNRRPDHVEDWWHIINWDAVNKLDQFWVSHFHDEL